MLIDVSIRLEKGMVFRKGSPPLDIKTINCFDETEGHYETTFLSTSVHIGTHIDVMDKNLLIPTERFFGRGILIDVSSVGKERDITLGDISDNVQDVLENDFVFFRTGWERFLGTESYFQHPQLAMEVVQLLVDKKVNMVGIDALGLGMNKNHGIYDRYLAEHNIFAIENLVNLDKIGSAPFKVFCFPLSIVGTEARPARIVVEL